MPLFFCCKSDELHLPLLSPQSQIGSTRTYNVVSILHWSADSACPIAFHQPISIGTCRTRTAISARTYENRRAAPHRRRRTSPRDRASHRFGVFLPHLEGRILDGVTYVQDACHQQELPKRATYDQNESGAECVGSKNDRARYQFLFFFFFKCRRHNARSGRSAHSADAHPAAQTV